MTTLPTPTTDAGRRLTRRQLQAGLDDARDVIADLDKQNAALRAELHQQATALDDAREALAAAQAVSLRLLEENHTQTERAAQAAERVSADHSAVVTALGRAIAEAQRPPLLAAPEPPELLPGGTHALTDGTPPILTPVDNHPARRRAR